MPTYEVEADPHTWRIAVEAADIDEAIEKALNEWPPEDWVSGATFAAFEVKPDAAQR